MNSSAYYIHMKAKILADFQICISVPLSTSWYVATTSQIGRFYLRTVKTSQRRLKKVRRIDVSVATS